MREPKGLFCNFRRRECLQEFSWVEKQGPLIYNFKSGHMTGYILKEAAIARKKKILSFQML